MKIIHSLWSKPVKSDCYKGVIGGWNKPIFFYMSWALSCLTYRKHYGEIDLYCDKAGKKMLIDIMGLPYSEVHVELDELNEYSTDLWALGKIYAYSVQKKSFIHVDYDSYIWDKFPSYIETADITVQHKEYNYKQNILYYNDVESNLSYIPDDILTFRTNNLEINEYNAGIIGGNDVTFFREYSEKAFKFVNENLSNIPKLRYKGMFNSIYEQYLFYCMCSNSNKKVNCLFDNPKEDFIYKNYFSEIGRSMNFIHAMSTAKRDYSTGEQIVYRLFFEFPEYYNKIVDLYKTNKLTNDFK